MTIIKNVISSINSTHVSIWNCSHCIMLSDSSPAYDKRPDQFLWLALPSWLSSSCQCILDVWKLLFHNQSEVFHWFNVRTVAWPFQNTDLWLTEGCLHCFRGVARSIILLENCSLVTLLTWNHFLLQDFLVHLAIDSASLWWKEESSMTMPAETAPNHYAGRVLHCRDGVLGIKWQHAGLRVQVTYAPNCWSEHRLHSHPRSTVGLRAIAIATQHL